MEDVLIYHNFNVGKNNYIDLNFMATGLMVDSSLSEEIRYMVYQDAVRTSVIDLLSFNDCEYVDVYKKTNCISSSCMLRAGLLLISDDVDMYNASINEIYKLIDELKDFYNGLSVDIIKSIIENVNIDKKRVRRLSIMPL